MLKTVGLSLALALLATPGAHAKDDDDAKVPAAEVEKIEGVLSTLGCKGYEGIEKEDAGVYEIEDAKCAMGTMDIKLDKDYTVILISRY
jgi:predicted outer membrane protein